MIIFQPLIVTTMVDTRGTEAMASMKSSLLWTRPWTVPRHQKTIAATTISLIALLNQILCDLGSFRIKDYVRILKNAVSQKSKHAFRSNCSYPVPT